MWARTFAQADADHYGESAGQAAKQHNKNTTTLLYWWPRTNLWASREPPMCLYINTQRILRHNRPEGSEVPKGHALSYIVYYVTTTQQHRPRLRGNSGSASSGGWARRPSRKAGVRRADPGEAYLLEADPSGGPR